MTGGWDFLIRQSRSLWKALKMYHGLQNHQPKRPHWLLSEILVYHSTLSAHTGMTGSSHPFAFCLYIACLRKRGWGGHCSKPKSAGALCQHVYGVGKILHQAWKAQATPCRCGFHLPFKSPAPICSTFETLSTLQTPLLSSFFLEGQGLLLTVQSRPGSLLSENNLSASAPPPCRFGKW